MEQQTNDKSGDQQFADELAKGWEHVAPEAALDELSRELSVRQKCFARWVKDGRLSKTDAKDRLQRLIKAGQMCQKVVDTQIPD